MKFISTRGGVAPVEMRTALEAGLAPDGGLFVPETFPRFKPEDFQNKTKLSEIANAVLAPFFKGDAVLEKALPEICKAAFNFEIPLTPVPNRAGDFILELYHGPTSAFKDVGARFLAQCMSRLSQDQTRTVLVATSGDTGGAVAAAFFNQPGIEVMILYPEGKISPRQEKQLCAWGGNIRAFAVQGTFDDCQRMVKEGLLDPHSKRKFMSANSINLGRILPQMIYYIASALSLSKQGLTPNFIIPSGNLGNSLAALWAKKLGFPVGKIHLALNANRGVMDYLATGVVKQHATIATLANAMDVGNPSNLERVKFLYPDLSDLNVHVSADSVSDSEIKNTIKTSQAIWGQVLCPHTATAAVSRLRKKDSGPWVLVSTAHPAKFETIVEPLIGQAVPVPTPLAEILKKPSIKLEIEATYSALKSKF